jgi:hypothetical protein
MTYKLSWEWKWLCSKKPNVYNTHQASPGRSESEATKRYGEPQLIQGGWIDESKLENLLQQKFQHDYQLVVGTIKIRIPASADHYR